MKIEWESKENIKTYVFIFSLERASTVCFFQSLWRYIEANRNKNIPHIEFWKRRVTRIYLSTTSVEQTFSKRRLYRKMMIGPCLNKIPYDDQTFDAAHLIGCVCSLQLTKETLLNQELKRKYCELVIGSAYTEKFPRTTKVSKATTTAISSRLISKKLHYLSKFQN